jgi:hypothetical protein
LNISDVLRNLKLYYDDLAIIHLARLHQEPAMLIQVHSYRTPRREALSRLADWWPAALIGLVALLGALPDANAQSLLGL